MGVRDKTILSTFGMMGRRKGIEHVIDALPAVVKKFPSVLYLIIGETHPTERKRYGESYRSSLERQVKRLGLQKHVKFYNKYLTLREVLSYLKATDVYIAPGGSSKQITSGTISYAMGCGRVVVATPPLHPIAAIKR